MEQSAKWPSTQLFDTMAQWLEWMKADHQDYTCGEEDQGKS
jgi:hypothetical protein